MSSILSQWLLVTSIWLGGANPADPVVAEKVFHPFYVSVTEVNQNISEKTLEISCKFFADDFENILEKSYKKQLDITSDKDKAVFDKHIPDYVDKHFSLLVDTKPVTLHYIGFEKEKESVYCYFEVTGVSSLSKLDIINNFLYDLTHEQINIMHVTVNGKRQSSKLNYPDVKASWQF